MQRLFLPHSLMIALSMCSAGFSVDDEKPNVLFIMVDDLRDFGGAFTQSLVRTPNRDRLRARGTTFERAYVQYTVCNPSRCSLMTGLRPEATGITDNLTILRSKLPDIITLPQLCKEAGWTSHAFGKLFHLGGGKSTLLRNQWMDTGSSWNTAQSFETLADGLQHLEGRNVTGGELKWCAWGAAAGTDNDQPDGQIATATVEMIKKLKNERWFIGCGFMKPHDPFIAPKKYFDMYPPESLVLWQDPVDIAVVREHSVGFGIGKSFSKFGETEWRELFRAYCACTTFMDAQLGRVLDALDYHKLWDNTIVVFIGDHGYHTGERQWWNKNTLFERACRAPLIIAAPGSQGGRISTSLVEFIDLYPTIADLCGLQVPHEHPGVSLRPILQNNFATVKDTAFTLVTRGADLFGQSVRTERWRLTRWSNGETELYDHASDPEEAYNVASQHSEIASELTLKIQALPAFRR